MGKNKKSEIVYDGKQFDSNEEVDFYKWCVEAKRYKIISEFFYNDKSYTLSEKKTITIEKKLKTKTKHVDKNLFHEHIYSPDFRLIKGERWSVIHDISNLLSTHDDETEFVVDVKGSFQLHDGSRSFSMNRKWMYDKYSIYVNKVIPDKFFKLTWLPHECRLTAKTKQPRKKYAGYKTLVEKFGNIEPQGC